MYYFSSDTHFNDESTLKNDNRPFKSVKKCDKTIIKTWNKQVKKGDTIFVIGDFMDCDDENSDGWKKSIHYVRKIKAPVILITGNNEDRIIKYYFDNNFELFRKYCLEVGFKEVYKNLDISFNNYNFHLVHKPKHHKEGVLNLFGHTHRSTGIYKPFGFNVGCDLNHFRLLSENDIMQYIYMKNKYWDKNSDVRS